MTKMEPVLNQIKSLIGTSFGHFKASDKALSDKYSLYMSGTNRDGSWGRHYQDKNGKIVADVTYDATGKTSKYSIYDHTRNIKYTSSKHKTENNSDKFDHIYVGDWVISDRNKNGIVDKDDAIGWAGEGPGPSTNLGNFLQNNNMQK